MADVFISSSRANRDRAAAVASALEQDGRSVGEFAGAASVVVAWSKAARDSLWVRAEANEALAKATHTVASRRNVACLTSRILCHAYAPA